MLTSAAPPVHDPFPVLRQFCLCLCDEARPGLTCLSGQDAVASAMFMVPRMHQPGLQCPGWELAEDLGRGGGWLSCSRGGFG